MPSCGSWASDRRRRSPAPLDNFKVMGFMSTGRQGCVWIALALALHLAPALRDGWHSGGAPQVEFAVPDAVPHRTAVEPPMCREEFVVAPQATTPFAHVSSICELG